MIEFSNRNEAMERLRSFMEIYNVIRIVNPVEKTTVETIQCQLPDTPEMCYTLCGFEKSCKNCISADAMARNMTTSKLVYKETGLYVLTAIPILFNDGTLVMELFQNITGTLYDDSRNSPELGEIISTVPGYIDHLISTDGLTGLNNRRFADERLGIDLANSYQNDYVLSIIYADLDFFKNINDGYGHLMGDKVLQEFGMLLKKNIRGQDGWSSRYGGEEFLICLPRVNRGTAVKIAERIRQHVMKSNFKVNGEVINVTCSFGVYATNQSEKHLTIHEIVDLADKNLYIAKNTGRNKVV